MDWTRAIDAYCERTDPSYWSEPVNAVTNLAFIVSAIVMWRRCAGGTGGRVLAAILFAIGVGSWLFHTHATPWAAMADTMPILLFTLVYIFLANRDFWGWPVWGAGLGALAYIPYTAALTPVFEALPFFATSSFYWPLPVLIFTYAALLRRRAPELARNLAIGAGILCVSLTARSMDEPLCAAIPLGTHFLWHILNAVMLGWMIETWRRHMATS
ncbi:ceramidase domain-containing protein [Silicimonas sp. MF1-12-2]|uniref:ceramidase domain-containing protein n=1 Tax=Silicimonas sp. MF1-12-2 TaxID=3384793 RepID=UPI0039B607AD